MIPIGIGFPQGCTASTINFIVGFQLSPDYLRYVSGHIGYRIKSTIVVSDPTFAADVALATTAPDCQRSLNGFKIALDWTQTLKPKASKCRDLAFRVFMADEKVVYTKFQRTTYSSFDPLLKIGDEPKVYWT